VLEVVRIRREGYPVRLSFLTFCNDFKLLLGAALRAQRAKGAQGQTQMEIHTQTQIKAEGEVQTQTETHPLALTHSPGNPDIPDFLSVAAILRSQEPQPRACAVLIAGFALESGCYQVGLSLIFLREGGIPTLKV
jgi:myosin heavy subunit